MGKEKKKMIPRTEAFGSILDYRIYVLENPDIYITAVNILQDQSVLLTFRGEES